MNPFARTKPELVTHNNTQKLFPQLKRIAHLNRELADEYKENGIAADFQAAEAAGGAAEGNAVNYGGYDSNDVRRWLKLTGEFEKFLNAPVTVNFADGTTETTTNRSLILRDYLPFVEIME